MPCLSQEKEALFSSPVISEGPRAGIQVSIVEGHRVLHCSIKCQIIFDSEYF